MIIFKLIFYTEKFNRSINSLDAIEQVPTNLNKQKGNLNIYKAFIYFNYVNQFLAFLFFKSFLFYYKKFMQNLLLLYFVRQ